MMTDDEDDDMDDKEGVDDTKKMRIEGEQTTTAGNMHGNDINVEDTEGSVAAQIQTEVEPIATATTALITTDDATSNTTAF